MSFSNTENMTPTMQLSYVIYLTLLNLIIVMCCNACHTAEYEINGECCPMCTPGMLPYFHNLIIESYFINGHSVSDCTAMANTINVLVSSRACSCINLTEPLKSPNKILIYLLLTSYSFVGTK